MHIIKCGLLGLSVLAAVGGTTGGLLAAQAGASPTRGPEVIRSTQYQVGASEGTHRVTGPHGVLGARMTSGPRVDWRRPERPAGPRWCLLRQPVRTGPAARA